MTDDAHDLDRFVAAQNGTIDDVERELRSGRKASHWMWFVFPQIAGLGSSPTARSYAIESVAQARTYLDHPVLGPRLRLCVELALGHSGRSANDIFGSPDDLKFRSCLTLFDLASPDDMFARGIEHFFGGEPDRRTLEILGRS